MARLIDADVLIEELVNTPFYPRCKTTPDLLTSVQDRLNDTIEIVQNMPTVDAVEVVRCKDCIGKAHWYKNNYGCTICGMSGLFVVEDRDFCSYGEREGNES